MSIRIRRIDTRVVEHRLRPERIIRSHAGLHDRSRFLIVTVHGEAGLRGYAEAATTALWSGETAETAGTIIQSLFAPKLIGASFDHPREALALMDAQACANPFAKSAVDTAIWDLWARAQNVRSTKLFADRDVVESIPTRASVGAYNVAETVRLAEEFWNAGIRTLKFKIGIKGIDDGARLRAVRDRLGDAPIFTVDGNGAYATMDEALQELEKMLPYRLALIEQPVPRERIALMAAIRRQIRVPMLADESVFTPEDLTEALDCDAFDILSIYPGKNGGFTRSLDMAQTAQRAGKTCSIGSNLETDLGQAAMACLAAGLSAFPTETLACDLGAAIFYEGSSVRPPLQYANGRVTVPTGIGFGVEPLEPVES